MTHTGERSILDLDFVTGCKEQQNLPQSIEEFVSKVLQTIIGVRYFFEKETSFERI